MTINKYMKIIKYIPITKRISTSELVKLFIYYIIKNFSIFINIISNKKSVFINKF
jgi:hypothetical protein